MICPKCGQEMPDGASFCQSCGMHVEQPQYQQPPAAAQMPQQPTYQPQQTSYTPQQTSYQPQQTSYNPQQTSYQPQQTSYNPQQTSYQPQYSQPVPPSPKKPAYKQWWFWLIIVVAAVIVIGGALAIALGGSDKKPAATPSPTVTVTATPTPTSTPTPTPAPTATPAATPAGSTYSDADVVTFITQSFSGNETLDYVEVKDGYCDIYLVAPSGTAEALTTSPDSMTSAWQDMIDSLCSSCDLFSQSLDLINRGDLTVCIYVENDANTENVLLAIVDGEVFYNVMDE